MRRTWRMCLAGLLLAAGGWGCASSGGGLTLGPMGSAAETAPATQAADVYDDSAWQVLLLKHVAAGWPEDAEDPKSRGPMYPALVDYRAIQAHPEDLNDYLRRLAAAGPTRTPEAFATDVHKLAYYINAFNACAIRAVLANYPTTTVYGPSMPAFEYEWYFQVDGRRVNLDDLRRTILAQAGGDVRVLLVLSSGAVGCPPLAAYPYRADGLFETLQTRAQEALAQPQMVTISHDQQQLQLWAGIVRHRDEFFAYYDKLYGARPESLLGVVLELCAAKDRQTLNKAVGYREVETPFDRRLNDLVVRAAGVTPVEASPVADSRPAPTEGE